MRCYDTSCRFFGDNERRNGRPISDLKALQKSKKPQALLPTVVRWARPRVICAPTFVPLFHLYTLAPLYLRPQSGHSRKVPLLDLSRTGRLS